MDKEKFAHNYGFESFEQMLESTFTIIYDHDVCWNATVTQSGWLGWITSPLEALGFFETFNQVFTFIHNFFSFHSQEKGINTNRYSDYTN